MPLVVLASLAAIAWIGVAELARHMGDMPGTMGLGFATFLGVWTLMMVAMMAPAVFPFASFYVGTFTVHRTRRLLLFSSGYLLLWALVGVPAFGGAVVAGNVARDHRGLGIALAVVVFSACGVYQLTPIKDRCLARCRTPLGFTLHYAGLSGRWRDVRAGLHHAAFCVGCCWALMLLLVAFGLMNLVAMMVVAAIVIIEKTWRRGARFGKVAGAIFLVLALVVVVHPALAPGLYESHTEMDGGM